MVFKERNLNTKNLKNNTPKLLMSQTTVNQYFVARKSNLTFQPSKKRKVDGSDTEVNAVKKKVAKQATTTTRPRSKRKQVSKQTPFNQSLFPNNAPIKEETIVPHVSPKKTLIAIDSIISKSPLGKVKIDDSINDQAKTILHSRGNAILQSCLQGKGTKSPAKASEILLSMSPKKSTPTKHEFSIKNLPTVDKDLQSRRDQLRKKYSNLLGDESIKDQTGGNITADERPSGSEKPAAADRRGHLRNKYKHLLKRDSPASSTITTNLLDDSTPKEKPKPLSSPQKAFEKYKHLTEKNVTSTFPLPQKYTLLLEMFRCTDSVLYLLQQRKETCTFDRLKKSVQSMSGREFTQKHLASMKTLYPTGFVFRQERNLYCVTRDGGKSKNFQLTIEADYKDMQISKTSIKNNSTILITRRLRFEQKLLDLTKYHHQKYLKKLNLKIDNSEIHRWHPHFKLEDVPDVELSALPKPPVTKSFSSAADLLLKNNFSPKVANALQKASDGNTPFASTNKTTTTTTTPTTTTTTKNQSNILKGVSSDLLERIRQKEQKKLELAMTRNPKKELRISRMERLPDMSRIIKSYFVSERKAAITLEDCVQKLSESYGTDLHTSNLEEHIKLIAELVPKWLQILPVRKCLYVKLARTFDINNVINLLSEVKKKEETTS